MSRRPTLVCINNAIDTMTRYIPKPTGGFFRERFEILDRATFDKSITERTIEQVRLGKMEGQETPIELEGEQA